MQAPSKFSITPIAAAVTAAIYPGTAAVAQDDEASNFALEEITVTARKRTESAQDIPISIQALSQAALASMGAKALEDYGRFIPSVNVVTYSAGSNTIVFRGAITGAGYIAQSTSSVYLDEISLTTTGSQPMVRMVDIARVEALSGPQGTLYGSDAQAGTMRIITNKPTMDGFEAVFDGELRGGDQSDPSYRGSIMFNIPIVEDKLAMRLVAYNDKDGGYIDNVFGNTPDTSLVNGAGFYPSGFGTLDNADVLEKKWNDADTLGFRGHLQWDISDNWSATFTALHQETEGGADNDYDPNVGDLQTIKFHDEWRTDNYQMYSMVIEGDLGFAQLVSATSYYEREIESLNDITAYAHYWAQYYCHDTTYTLADLPYYWADPTTGYINFFAPYCQGPSTEADFYSSYWAPAQQDKFTQEIRISHYGDTIDWIGGFYYEESTDAWQAPFATPTAGGRGDVNTWNQSAARGWMEWYWSRYYGSPQTFDGDYSNWYSNSHTEWEQKAVFGEFTWHVSDTLDLTVGGRYFDRSNTNWYFVMHPGEFTGFNRTANGEPDYFDAESRQYFLDNGEPQGRTGEEKEFIPKVALSWGFSDDKLVYGLYTQGKRPGGINRSRGDPFFPNQYDADLMDNYEIGYKSSFGDGRGRFNATAYYMLWSDYQLEQVDPASTQCLDANGVPQQGVAIPQVCGQPWQQVVANAGEAHIQGLNLEVDYAAGDNWILGANVEFMEAETDTNHDLNGDGIDNLVAGLRLPIVPEYKGAVWAEYRWEVGSRDAFIRTQWSHQGDTLNILEEIPDDGTDANPQTKNPSYTIGDLRAGLIGETWEVSVFVNNLTDERATYTHGTGQFLWGMQNLSQGREHVQRVYTNRPREFGIRYMKRWGGN